MVGDEHESSTSDDAQLNEAALRYDNEANKKQPATAATASNGEQCGEEQSGAAAAAVSSEPALRRLRNSLSEGFSQIFGLNVEESFRSMANPFSGHSLSQPCDGTSRNEEETTDASSTKQPDSDDKTTSLDAPEQPGPAAEPMDNEATAPATDHSDIFQSIFNYASNHVDELEKAANVSESQNEKKRRNSSSSDMLTGSQFDLLSPEREQERKKSRTESVGADAAAVAVQSEPEPEPQQQQQRDPAAEDTTAPAFENQEANAAMLNEIIEFEPSSKEKETTTIVETEDASKPQDQLNPEEEVETEPSMQSSTPLSRRHHRADSSQGQEETPGSPGPRPRAPPTESSIKITRKNGARSSHQPMESNSPLPTTPTIDCYTRYVVKTTTQTVVKTTVTHYKQVCDLNDNILKSSVVSTKSNQRIIADNCDKKFIPAGRHLGLADFEFDQGTDVFEEEPQPRPEPVASAAKNRSGSGEMHDDDYEDAGGDLSSPEHSVKEIEDFIDEVEENRLKENARREAAMKALRPVVSLARLPPSHQLPATPKSTSSKVKEGSRSSQHQDKRSKSILSDSKASSKHRDRESSKLEEKRHRSKSTSKYEEQRHTSSKTSRRHHSEQESRSTTRTAAATPKSLSRATRNSAKQPAESAAVIKERSKKRQEDLKSTKSQQQHQQPPKYQEKPIVCFKDLKLKLSARELNMDHENLKTQLQTISSNGGEVNENETDSPEKPLEKSTRNNVQLRNAFDISQDEDAMNSKSTSGALKHASSSALPLYQAPMIIPYDPNESYQCAIQQAIQGIESFENQCSDRATSHPGPAVVMAEPATYSTSVSANYMQGMGEDDDVNLLPPMHNDLVDHEITIPFQEPTDEELASTAIYNPLLRGSQVPSDLVDMAAAEAAGDKSRDESSSFSLSDSMNRLCESSSFSKRGRARRVRAPLSQFAQSFGNKLPSKRHSSANEERLKTNFRIKECSVTMEKLSDQELRLLMTKKRSSSNNKAPDAGAEEEHEAKSPGKGKLKKRILQPTRRTPKSAKKSPSKKEAAAIKLNGSSSSLFTMEDGTAGLNESTSKNSADSSYLATPAAPPSTPATATATASLNIHAVSTFHLGEHVFARQSDGNYHPAVIVSTGEVFLSNGSSYPTYSCGFIESADQLINLDSDSTLANNLRSSDLIKTSLIAANDHVFVKSSSNRKSKFMTGKLISSTPPKTAASGDQQQQHFSPPDFCVQFIEHGNLQVRRVTFDKIVIPKIQETNPWAQITGKRTPKPTFKASPSSSSSPRSKTFKTTTTTTTAIDDDRYSIEHGYSLEAKSQQQQHYSRTNTLKWKRASTSSVSSAESLQPNGQLVLEPLKTFTISQSDQQIYKGS